MSLLADLHFAQGSFAESADAAERYLSLEPDDREIQARAYQAYRRAGNQAKVDEWRALLVETGAAKQMAIDVYNEGAQANQEGNVDAAVERFQVALDLDPALAEAHAGFAAIYFNQSRYDEALTAVELLSGRAEIDFRAGRRRDARAALLKILEIEPNRARAHYMLGLIYAQDDTAKAREHLERFIALAPTAPESVSRSKCRSVKSFLAELCYW